ncbi:MAG: YciK family oxidoreductase [Gammaproteobacteria bacterium]|nr:YciK family oxidoreductase [Gammaproteobacteria bacterium]
MTVPQPLNSYQARPGLLQDKIIFLTGATGAIGRAVALAAAAHGAQLILSGRKPRALEALCDEIEALPGAPRPPRAVPINLEGAGLADYEQIAEVINHEYGRLDGLVANAAVLGQLTPVASFDPVLWARIFQVNLHSVFLMTQAFLPLLRAAASASVVMTSSSVARKPRAFWGAYAASKAAMESMAGMLADELASTGVRVNTLNPLATRSPMRALAYPAEDPSHIPAPESVAPAFLFLLGDDSHAITGQQLDAR